MTFSVTKNGKPLDTSLYNQDKETRTFSTNESYLVLDFSYYSDCTFKTGSNCTFDTGYCCIIIRRDIFEVIQLKENEVIQICPYLINGYLVNGIYSETGLS